MTTIPTFEDKDDLFSSYTFLFANRYSSCFSLSVMNWPVINS